MTFSAGHRGEEIRNDCWVELTPGDESVVIESTVGSVYGPQIKAEVRDALATFAGPGVGARVVDAGAFHWCIRARIQAAAAKIGPPHQAPPFEPRPRHEIDALQTRLYLPGNTPKFFINARLHGADAVVLDLEDSVPPAEKEEARALVCHALAHVDFGDSIRVVRINAGPLGEVDAVAVESAGADALLAPKVESSGQIERLNAGVPVIPLLESALGIARALEIAQAPGVVALGIGVEDYCADIGADRTNSSSLDYAYGQVVNAARAAGVLPLASVWADIDDDEGFAAEIESLAARGFEGVGCLHPAQVPVAQRAFSPKPELVEWARAVVEAFESAQGAISVNGQMVDAPVAARARRILTRSDRRLPSWRVA